MKADHIKDWESPPPEGYVFIDVCEGCEGPSLYVGDQDGQLRVAGPKPWGGGRTSYRFTVSLEQLKAAIEAEER